MIVKELIAREMATRILVICPANLVLQWRQEGAGYDELAPRFRRSPEFLERVEALAVYKLGGAPSA